uniref:Cytochrome c oxidase copper chaperone n=1 Tax=Arion vulgaris TaxID=1028688 RepID=A0A0B7B550_9EUPU
MPAEKPQLSGTGLNGNNEVQEKPKLRPCCACPETKKARDLCVIERGEENCGDLIEKHKQCMRDLGFKI